MPRGFLIIKITSLCLSLLFIGRYLLALENFHENTTEQDAPIVLQRPSDNFKKKAESELNSRESLAGVATSILPLKVLKDFDILIKVLSTKADLSLGEQLQLISRWSNQLPKTEELKSNLPNEGPAIEEVHNLEILQGSLNLITEYPYLQRSDCPLLKRKILENFEPLAGSMPQNEALKITWKILDQICSKNADE